LGVWWGTPQPHSSANETGTSSEVLVLSFTLFPDLIFASHRQCSCAESIAKKPPVRGVENEFSTIDLAKVRKKG